MSKVNIVPTATECLARAKAAQDILDGIEQLSIRFATHCARARTLWSQVRTEAQLDKIVLGIEQPDTISSTPQVEEWHALFDALKTESDSIDRAMRRLCEVADDVIRGSAVRLESDNRYLKAEVIRLTERLKAHEGES